MFFCFISIDERRPSSQGTPTAPARTARSDRDPARFATGSPDLPSPGLPEVPSGRRPPGVGPHRWLSRRTNAPVHCASPTKARVQRWLRNYRKLRAKLEAICELNHELLGADP